MTNAPLEIARKAKEASYKLRMATTAEKNRALALIAEGVSLHKKEILEANQKDLQAAKALQLSNSTIDRLDLTGKLEGIIDSVREVIELADPVHEIFDEKTLSNGLKLHKKRIPLGVLAVIYEARPNVTIEIASLALKTTNCAILRGGKEALHTNKKFVEIIQKALAQSALPKESIQFIESEDRNQVRELLSLDQYIDVIIPRGGKELQRFCLKESSIPVITGGIGICHLFMDESGDAEKATEVVFNAKTQRPSVCNALDTLLVHQKIASTFLPKLLTRLSSKQVTLALDPKSAALIKTLTLPPFQQVAPEWDREWLGMTLGIKIVDNLEQAIDHIQHHSSGHSDGILSENKENIDKFLQAIDSAVVYVNASTRFTDGGEFGLGAEVAVSTQKLHARGPMGLLALTTYMWVVEGDYHTR